MNEHTGQESLKKIGKSFFRYTWAFVDSDYLDTLPPAERAWMIQFLLEYYRCESKNYGKNRLLTREQELDAYKRNTAAYKDVLSFKDKMVNRMQEMEEWSSIEDGDHLSNAIQVEEPTPTKKRARKEPPGPLDKFLRCEKS